MRTLNALLSFLAGRVTYEHGRFLAGAIVNEMTQAERDEIDRHIVATSHPLGFVPGTQETRIALYAREYAQQCRWCGQRLTNDNGTLVDETGGDVCGTREAQDDTATGTNPPHVPR